MAKKKVRELEGSPLIYRHCPIYRDVGAQIEIDVVSPISVSILSLCFNFEYVLYVLDISKVL